MNPIYFAIFAIIALLLVYRIPSFILVLRNVISSSSSNKRQLFVLTVGLFLHLCILTAILWLIWSKYTSIGAISLSILLIIVFIYRLIKKSRSRKQMRLVKTIEQDGYKISLIEDWARHRFELRFAKADMFVKREYIPWTHEPRYGIDVDDLANIKEVTDKVLLKLKGIEGSINKKNI